MTVFWDLRRNKLRQWLEEGCRKPVLGVWVGAWSVDLLTCLFATSESLTLYERLHAPSATSQPLSWTQIIQFWNEFPAACLNQLSWFRTDNTGKWPHAWTVNLSSSSLRGGDTLGRKRRFKTGLRPLLGCWLVCWRTNNNTASIKRRKRTRLPLYRWLDC